MSKIDNIDEMLHQQKHLTAKRMLVTESIDDQLDEIDNELQNLVNDICRPYFPDADDFFYDAGGWDCESEKNPLPCCVYDEVNDPCFDDCLFCHQPWERK